MSVFSQTELFFTMALRRRRHCYLTTRIHSAGILFQATPCPRNLWDPSPGVFAPASLLPYQEPVSHWRHGYGGWMGIPWYTGATLLRIEASNSLCYRINHSGDNYWDCINCMDIV